MSKRCYSIELHKFSRSWSSACWLIVMSASFIFILPFNVHCQSNSSAFNDLGTRPNNNYLSPVASYIYVALNSVINSRFSIDEDSGNLHQAAAQMFFFLEI